MGTEQNRTGNGLLTLGRNWAKIEHFLARIRTQKVPKISEQLRLVPIRRKLLSQNRTFLVKLAAR